MGNWILGTNGEPCSEDLWVPPADPRLMQADLPAARTPFPEPALFDWCQLLVTGPAEDIVSRPPPFLYAESGPIGKATVSFSIDKEGRQRFGVVTARTGRFEIDYPAFCMRAFGATNKSPDMGGDVCQQLAVSLGKKGGRRYHNIACQLQTDDPPDQAGCYCQFDLTDYQESSGIFQQRSARTIRYLSGGGFPQTTTFCHRDNSLQLTGNNGEYLFDRVGLRTLSMVKTDAINCDDGLAGIGEDGIDCGAACEFMCSVINCADGMQGPGEDGADCGRRCGVPCP
jgi:hypothetical protein